MSSTHLCRGHQTDARIGRRVSMGGRAVHLTWPGRTGLRRRPPSASGVFADISVTGAAVIVPEGLPIEEGALVTLQVDGAVAQTVVRAITGDGPGTERYGLEYRRMNDEFRHLVEAALHARRGAVT